MIDIYHLRGFTLHPAHEIEELIDDIVHVADVFNHALFVRGT